MPRKPETFSPDPAYPKDPVQLDREIREREAYLASLFHPIYLENRGIPLKWLVPGFLPLGYLALLAADPKEGKTCFATALALAVATGTPFAGMKTHQHAVLWLSTEESPDERRLLFHASPLADPSTPLYTCYEHLPIDTEDGISALTHWIRETEAGLLVVDPLHGAQSGRSLSDGWAARRTLKMLKRFCAEQQITALVLHHAKHPSNYSRRAKVAENAQLAAVASMDMVMSHRLLSPTEVPPPPRFCDSEKEEGVGGRRPKRPSRAIIPRQGPLRRDEVAPEPPPVIPRLVTLNSRGRGLFANRLLHFLSRGPLDFMRLDDPGELVLPPHENNWIEDRILEMLTSGPKTSVQMDVSIQVGLDRLRKHVSGLHTRGLIKVVRTRKWQRYWGLVHRNGAQPSDGAQASSLHSDRRHPACPNEKTSPARPKASKTKPECAEKK